MTSTAITQIGTTGFVFNRKSVMTLFISIEITTLGATTHTTNTAFFFEDASGTIFSTTIITTAGAESAIGTSTTVGYYRTRGHVNIEN
uniref:NADH dehydrogenase subunit 4L n=1 Tax=Magnusiomyces fungicola TaxID=1734004 RepID=UPI001BEF5A9D|nr:NADH dehydrogenase subunit 4L [Saprochaete fungicola]QUV75104.1 NADH dehydrogenase subunit 4L [Saprochaete fungicola]